MISVRLAVFLLVTFPLLSADPPSVAIRGRLSAEQGKPSIESGGKRIALEGDEPTMKVLQDERLTNADVEVLGHYSGPGRFTVDPMHKQALWTYKNGKRLMVSYWCDVCYIRTYSPGKCWCCQKNTDLDPIDPDHAH